MINFVRYVATIGPGHEPDIAPSCYQELLEANTKAWAANPDRKPGDVFLIDDAIYVCISVEKDTKGYNPPQRLVETLGNKELQRIMEALQGDHGEDQQKIALAILDIGNTLLRKNSDYGSSAFSAPILAPTLPSTMALRVRMSDKIARIKNLFATQDRQVKDEPVTDSFKD